MVVVVHAAVETRMGAALHSTWDPSSAQLRGQPRPHSRKRHLAAPLEVSRFARRRAGVRAVDAVALESPAGKSSTSTSKWTAREEASSS